MKKLLFIFVIFFSFLAKAQEMQTSIPKEYGYKVKLGETVPNFILTPSNGNITSMQELRGKVVMLQFTASWCAVCRKEMPHIEQEIWQVYKEHPDFALYGIDIKEAESTVNKFKVETGISYPIALDPNGEIFDLFTVENAGVTRNIIVDKDGKIVFLTRLFKKEEFEAMKQCIAKMLAE